MLSGISSGFPKLSQSIGYPRVTHPSAVNVREQAPRLFARLAQARRQRSSEPDQTLHKIIVCNVSLLFIELTLTYCHSVFNVHFLTDKN